MSGLLRNTSVLQVVGVLVCMVAVCACAFSGCAAPATSVPDANAEQQERSVQLAGDDALPALDGEYSYVIAKVLEKDADAQTLTVEVQANEVQGSFALSSLAVGEVGAVCCDKLVFFPSGINIGTTVAVACRADDADAFPATAYAIEKLEWFEERVQRQQT